MRLFVHLVFMDMLVLGKFQVISNLLLFLEGIVDERVDALLAGV